MKIGLYNLESKYKNLAIEKLRIYHQQCGDEVEDYIALSHYNKTYASSIFTLTIKDRIFPDMVCGGTGFDLTTTLAPEIEAVKPHLNFGFTTRGCIRKCPFCVVPQKEGYVRVEGDLLDVWDGKTKDVVLYDNNILALPEHFNLICQQSKQHGIRLDFNQGLDHDLLTSEIVKLLSEISHVEYHFAFDYPSYKPTVERAINLLKDVGIKRSTWYVLVGYNTTIQEDLDRLNYLREQNQNAYVQRYTRKSEYISMARWANQHHIFHGMTWTQFLKAESKL